MDTRFWGPSGWRLLHLVSFNPNLDGEKTRAFFKDLPYVLPCKFCRASLSDYYDDDPIPTKKEDFPQWLYRIHNRVNDKLREQKLLDAPNPEWNTIQQSYTNWLRNSCSEQNMIGWDFLFSVAFTTPCKAVETSPMPDAPPIQTLHTPELRNRWSVMCNSERIPYIQEWWSLLPHVLPYKKWTEAWLEVVPTTPKLQKGRRAITSWLYRAEKAMCKRLEKEVPHESFEGLCSELHTFASGCGRAITKAKKTCRSTKSTARHTLKQRRSTKYFATGGYL